MINEQAWDHIKFLESKINDLEGIAKINFMAADGWEARLIEAQSRIKELEAEIKGYNNILYDEVKCRQKWQERSVELQTKLEMSTHRVAEKDREIDHLKSSLATIYKMINNMKQGKAIDA